MKNTKQFLILILIFALNGCVIGYRKYPRAQLGASYPDKQYEKLYYFIDGSSLAGGYVSLREVFKHHSPFIEVEEREEPPQEGLYIRAKIQNIPFSMATMIFGYISYATLTLTPVWSTKDGSIIRFHVYKDAELQKIYDYDVRRTGAIWLGLLPFIWANALTANEEGAFSAVAKQFFEDAQPHF